MKKVLEKIIDIAKAQGADQADVIITSGDVIKAKSENLEISDYSVNSSQTIGIRVIKQNKTGISYCETTDEKPLRFMIDQALANSEFSKEEPQLKIDVERTHEIDGTKTTFNPIRTEPKKIIDQAILLEKENQAKGKNIKTPMNIVGESVGEYYYMNHFGTYCQEYSKTAYGTTSIIIEDSGKNSTFAHMERAEEFSDVNFKKITDEAFRHASLLLTGTQVPTGKYNIVLSPDSLASLFGAFSNLFSGYASIKDLNPFKEKLNLQVANPLLTIVDKPKKQNGSAYTAFDSEGNLTEELTLIDKGTLKSFYQNSLTSKILRMNNTFHAFRGPKSTLTTSGTNKVISTGLHSTQDFDNEKYLELIKLQGLHSGFNNITGDFSFAASGYLYDKGEMKQSIKGVTISGNFFELLNKIAMVGEESFVSSGKSFFTPKIMFHDISVGGK